jgi:hypothetical protein
MNRLLNEFELIPTFEEDAFDSLNPQYKIALPNRDYTNARNNQLFTRYDDPDFINVQQENVNKNTEQLAQDNLNKLSKDLNNRLDEFKESQRIAELEKDKDMEEQFKVLQQIKEIRDAAITRAFKRTGQPTLRELIIPDAPDDRQLARLARAFDASSGAAASSSTAPASSSTQAIASTEPAAAAAAASEEESPTRRKPLRAATVRIGDGIFFEENYLNNSRDKKTLLERLLKELNLPSEPNNKFDKDDVLRKQYMKILGSAVKGSGTYKEKFAQVMELRKDAIQRFTSANRQE